MSTTRSKKKIRYGKKDLLPEMIDRKDVKIRISMILEGDLLDAIRLDAEKNGRQYQTHIKDILRHHLASVNLPADFAKMLESMDHANRVLREMANNLTLDTETKLAEKDSA